MVFGNNGNIKKKQPSSHDEGSNLKFTLDDWRYTNFIREQSSETLKKLAREIIAKSDKLCDLSSETVKKNRDDTNHFLEERIKEINYCKQELVRNKNELIFEIDALSTYKDRLKDSLAAVKKDAIRIITECLEARDRRLGIDLVKDNVELELRTECERIMLAQKLMSETLDETKEQLRCMKANLYFMEHDIEDKENNLRIDRHNTTLKETNLNLSIYYGKSSLNASDISIEEWEMQTKKNIEGSAKDIQKAKKIRSRIDHILKHLIDMLTKQKERVEEAFKCRIKETKELKGKLELQHGEVMRQANEMARNITKLEKAIAEKEGFIALAHTRLGNRCQRPGLELTCDYVEKSLSKEISDLRELVSELQKTLFEAQASLRFLLKTQVQLEEDINVKTNTLKIDEVICLTKHQTIKFHAF